MYKTEKKGKCTKAVTERHHNIGSTRSRASGRKQIMRFDGELVTVADVVVVGMLDPSRKE